MVAVFENLPVEVIRYMYSRGFLTHAEMCRLAITMRDKKLKNDFRELCRHYKRKRNNRNRSPPSPANKNKKTVRKAPMKAKRPWLK